MCSMNSSQQVICALAVAVGVTTISAGGQQSSKPAPEQTKTTPRDAGGFTPKPGIAYVNIIIPKPLTRSELAWCSGVLSLDETQRVLLNLFFFEEYQQRDADLRRAHVGRLWERSAAIGERGLQNGDPDVAAAFEDLMRDRGAFVKRVNGVDDWLFSELQTVLTEAQISRLPRARARRDRTVYHELRCEYPGGGIDLAFLLYRLESEFDLRPSDPIAFDELLAQYEIEVTKAVRAHYRDKLKAIVESPKLLASRRTMRIEGADNSAELTFALAERFLEENRRLNRGHVRAGKRLHALNRKYLASLGAFLEPDLRAEFTSRYQTAAYPPVYPDPYDADPILLAIDEIEFAEGEQEEIVKQIGHLYRHERDILAEKMVRRYVSWKAEFAERRSFHPNVFEAYKQEMRKLQEARAANATKLVAQIKGVLTPEQQAEIMPEILAFESRANAHEPTQIGIRYRP